LAASAGNFTAPLNAQEFRIEEASSLAELSIDQLKPKTIAFIDQGGGSDELIDPDVGLIRFEDWAQAALWRDAGEMGASSARQCRRPDSRTMTAQGGSRSCSCSTRS
jgi:hypothetical protein